MFAFPLVGGREPQTNIKSTKQTLEEGIKDEAYMKTSNFSKEIHYSWAEKLHCKNVYGVFRLTPQNNGNLTENWLIMKTFS